MYYHRVWADIDLEALSFNLAQIKSRIPKTTGVMVVVKADAYGHGAVHIARHLQKRDLWGFGVGDSHEALELRAAGIERPILILGAIIEDEIEKVVKNDISVCVHSAGRAGLLDREARRQGKKCRVHLMVDTGMGRLGVLPENAIHLARGIVEKSGLILEGVASHYAATSNPNDPFNAVQLGRFMEVKEALHAEGIRPAYFHASNSGALFSLPVDPFNLVRPGIALYGICASKDPSTYPSLKPVLSWKTQIIYMKDVPAGTSIGYDRLHKTSRPTRIATLPIGYNDGFSYRLSGRAHVLVHGKRSPVVDAVSMDYTMIDVGYIEGTAVGDPVTLIGREGRECIRVEDLAGMAETIPYEIICGIGKRVRRIAVDGSVSAGAGSERGLNGASGAGAAVE